MTENILYGYLTSRSKHGIAIPIPIQTVYLRSYAESNNFIFSMPRMDWAETDSYKTLFELVENPDVCNIAICSLFMVNFIEFEKSFMTQNKDQTIFHFPLESKIFCLDESIAYFKEYQLLKSIAMPKNLFSSFL